MGRGGRIVIDRVSEPKPFYGDPSHEIYRSTLPISAVRARPAKKESSVPGIVLPGATEIAAAALPTAVLPAFNRVNPECATSVKRTYQEVMQDQNHVSFCNCEGALTFNLASEMTVHVEPVKRMILSRNNVNDQIQFFL